MQCTVYGAGSLVALFHSLYTERAFNSASEQSSVKCSEHRIWCAVDVQPFLLIFVN